MRGRLTAGRGGILALIIGLFLSWVPIGFAAGKPIRFNEGTNYIVPYAVSNFFLTSRGARCVKAADLNSDGKMDAVVGTGVGTFSVYIGDGNGGFSSPANYRFGEDRQARPAMAFGDFDLDGTLDLAVLDIPSDQISVFRGQGDGSLQPPTVFRSNGAGSLEAGEFTGDGIPDLAVTRPGELAIWKGDGHGGFSFTNHIVMSADYLLTTGKFDEDQEIDLASIGGRPSKLFLFLGVQTSASKIASHPAELDSFWAFAAGRMIGNLDSVAYSGGVGNQPHLIVMTPTETGAIRQDLTGPPYCDIAIEDMDGDGLGDVVAARYPSTAQVGTFDVFLGSGQLVSPKMNSFYLPTIGIERIAVADFNRDGRPDIAYVDGLSYFGLALQQRPPTFTSDDFTTFEEKIFGSFQVVADANPAATIGTSRPLPAGLSLESNGRLSGTPAEGTAGTYLLDIVAMNGVGDPVGQRFALTVTGPRVPRVILPRTQTVTVTSASLVGEIQTDNGFPISRRGVVFAPTAVNANPQVGGAGVLVVDDATLAGGVVGGEATGLLPGTRYSFAVFAENARGVGYSSVETFFTLPDPNSGSLVVTTLTDENDGNSAPGLGAGTSLREAIAYAMTLGGNQTISFLPSLFTGGTPTITLTLGELAIQSFNGTLTIAGPGADMLTVSGGNASRILRVDNAGVRLEGLTFAAGRSNEGGAIRNAGTLVVNDCIFAQNTTATVGGAICQAGGVATVARSTFLGNFAANPTGNPFTGLGGAIANIGGTIWVINSTLFGNSATANGSGGGGAIVSAHSSATTRIINSTIVGNSTDGASGGVYLFGGTVALQNTIVAGNTAPFEPDVASTIDTSGAGNVIGGNPADLFTTVQPAYHAGSTPTYALKAGSAAIDAGLNELAVDATLAALSTEQRGGRRIRLGTVDAGSTEFAAPPTLDAAATLADLTATSATLGGTVMSDGGGLLRRGVIFSRTAENPNPVLGGTGAVVVEVPGGAGVFNRSVNLLPLTGYSFVAFAESEFGAVYSSVVAFTTPELPGLVVTTESDTLDSADGQTTLREAAAYARSGRAPANAPITFDPALTAGGPIVLALADTLTLAGAVTVTGPGPDLMTLSGSHTRRVLRVAAGASVALSGLTFSDGHVDHATYPEGNGAGVLNEGALTVSNCVFTGHVSGGTARGDGAALYHHGSALLVQECKFRGNQTQGGGFGAAIGMDSGTGAILASTFHDNHAQGNAGGLVNYGTFLGVTNCTFTGNTADNGAAIIHYGNILFLTHCTVAGNTARFTGGGIERVGRVGNDLMLLNNLIAKNSAPVGPDAFSYTDLNLGALTSLGHNLVGIGDDTLGVSHGVSGDLVGTAGSPIDPLLGPLANTNSSTPTMALLPGSPAVNAGLALAGLSIDQRGILRPQFGTVDIGAFEQTPFDTGQTVVQSGGAAWYVGPDAIGNDLRIYRQIPGQVPTAVDGAALYIGQLNDGSVLVKTSGGSVFVRLGSTTGLGSGWQLLESVAAGDGASWLLSSESYGNDSYIYRWANAGAATYSGGAGRSLSVEPDGTVLTRITAGDYFRRIGSNAGLGSIWQIVVVASAPAQLSSPSRPSDGKFSLEFTGQSGASFTVYATTDITLPLKQWSNLGRASENPPGSGQFQFTDDGATNAPRGYYRVTSP